VVARVPLEPRRSLYVVEVAGKTLLVGTSEMGLSVLSELDGREVKARITPPQSFADLVRGAWQRRKGLADAETSTPDPVASALAPDAPAAAVPSGAGVAVSPGAPT
jgi:flagellar biogenesis protein FliO